MSRSDRWATAAAALALAAGAAAPAGDLMAGTDGRAATRTAIAALGRTATPAEIAAWDIDVRPDFEGLPPGRELPFKPGEL